jgi:hypothetical protein
LRHLSLHTLSLRAMQLFFSSMLIVRLHVSGGGGSVTLLLFAICALGVAGFFARKQGMLDSLLRPRAAIRVDGSEEKVGIVDAVEAGVAGCDGLHPAEESPSSKGQDRPLM